jgi:hypothetical protein
MAAGSGQRTDLEMYFPLPLVAIVKDNYGNVVCGVSVTFTIVPDNGAGGTFSNGQTTISVTTNAKGLAIVPFLKANDVAGSFTVTAAVSGVEQDAVFTETNL